MQRCAQARLILVKELTRFCSEITLVEGVEFIAKCSFNAQPQAPALS
jgi:hypothetical protein